MRLLLARHGNTFESDQIPILIGACQDLPLVQRGVEQARILARYLEQQQLVPDLIISATLIRTKQFAEEIARGSSRNPPIRLDSRLNEIDYGSWAGKSSQELSEGSEALEWEKWDKKCIWPTTAGFSPSAETISANLKALSAELLSQHAEQSCVLCISSNGILRYFLSLVEGELERRVASASFKMATGSLSILDLTVDRCALSLWNHTPKT